MKTTIYHHIVYTSVKASQRQRKLDSFIVIYNKYKLETTDRIGDYSYLFFDLKEI